MNRARSEKNPIFFFVVLIQRIVFKEFPTALLKRLGNVLPIVFKWSELVNDFHLTVKRETIERAVSCWMSFHLLLLHGQIKDAFVGEIFDP